MAKGNTAQAADAGSKPKKKIRVTNDLELIRMILEENTLLKQKVLRLLEKNVGRKRGGPDTEG